MTKNSGAADQLDLVEFINEKLAPPPERPTLRIAREVFADEIVREIQDWIASNLAHEIERSLERLFLKEITEKNGTFEHEDEGPLDRIELWGLVSNAVDYALADGWLSEAEVKEIIDRARSVADAFANGRAAKEERP